MTPLEVWEKVVERARTRMDRVWHTRSRRQARTRATSRGWPRQVVIVCYGNICRSPYAAASMKRRLVAAGADGVLVDSAGLIGPGRPANQQASAVAVQRGHDLTGHRSRLFGTADSMHADLILVMTHSQRAQLVSEFGVRQDRIELLGDFDQEDPPHREILDPYGKSEAVFVEVFSQIDRSVDGLLAAWLPAFDSMPTA